MNGILLATSTICVDGITMYVASYVSRHPKFYYVAIANYRPLREFLGVILNYHEKETIKDYQDVPEHSLLRVSKASCLLPIANEIDPVVFMGLLSYSS